MTPDGPVENFREDVRGLWRSQPIETLALSPAQLRQQADRFQRIIRRRNLTEYLAALFVAIFFGAKAILPGSLASRVGPALMVVGALFIVYWLRTRGSSRPLPPEALAEASLTFHRRELERQHQLLSGVWRWYLGPLVPGMAVLIAHSALTADGRTGLILIGVSAGACALLFLGIGHINQGAARKIAEELRALENQDTDTARQGPPRRE